MKILELFAWLDSQKMEYTYYGSMDAEITGFSSLDNYKRNSLTWIKNEKNYLEAGRPSGISCAVVQKGVRAMPANAIVAENSKEVFFGILSHFWGRKREKGITGTGTVIAQSAWIHPTAAIGSNCSIEAGVSIGADTVIGNNVSVCQGVTIGSGCIIHSGAVIGADGFGYFFDGGGGIHKAEHFGSVEIGCFVEIGANACIDRGTIGNTVIGDCSKIDNLVHIAHNVQIGKSACVVAGAVICGSVKLGGRGIRCAGRNS